MKSISLISAIRLCSKYKNMPAPQRDAVRQERLQALVEHARSNSPYYAALYQNAPADITLYDLPPVNKVTLMEHWDDWCTDRRVTFAGVRAFMEDSDNIGRKWNGKYLVFTTSGSTGSPLVTICDDTTNNVMSAINVLRSYARKEDMKAFLRNGKKTIGVFANGGFYLGNSSVRARQLQMPWKKRQMAVTSALLPVDDIVAQLNAFQPAMLGGYPSNLELLIDEAEAGRLRISPVIIMTGGENLSDALRKRLGDVFHCYVQTSYSCTEGGTVACECRKQHFHINDDWLIVEPVDANNQPVPDGVLSDKLLLTNLFNYTQPYIRYEVTDRIIMHHEPCGCGNPSPWIEIEGRNDDVVSFTENGKCVRIPPLAIYAVLKEVHEVRRFQLLVYPENRAELRLTCAKGVSREAAFLKAQQALTAFFASYGLCGVTLALSDDEPQQQAGSGKFKHIIHMD